MGANELDHKSATKVILQTSIALLGGEAVEGSGTASFTAARSLRLRRSLTTT